MIFAIIVTSSLIFLSLNEATPVPALQVVERVDFPSTDQDYHIPIIPIIPPKKDEYLNLDPGNKMTPLNLDPVPLTSGNLHKSEKDKEFDAFLSSLQNSEDDVQENFNPSQKTNNFPKTPYVIHPVIENVNTQVKDKISNDAPLSSIQSVKESTVKETTRNLASRMSNDGISSTHSEDFPESNLHTSDINSNIEQVFGTGPTDAQHLFDNHASVDDTKVNVNKGDIDKIFGPGKNTDVSPVQHDTASSSLHYNSDLTDNMGTGYAVKEPSSKESVPLESTLKDINTQKVENKISNGVILNEATDFSEHTGTLHTSDMNHNIKVSNIDLNKEKIQTDSNIEGVFGAGPKDAQPISDDAKGNVNIADIDKVFSPEKNPIPVPDSPLDKPLNQEQQPAEQHLDNVDMNPDETDALPFRNSQNNGGGNSSFGFLKKLITSAVQSIVHGLEDLTGIGRRGCGSSCGDRFGDVTRKTGSEYNVNEPNSEAVGINVGGRQSAFNLGMNKAGEEDETPSKINEKATFGGFTPSRGSGMESFPDEFEKMPGKIGPGNGREMGYGVNSMPGGMWPVGPGPVFMPGRRPPFPPMGPGWGFRGNPYNEPNFDRSMPRNYMFGPPLNNDYLL